MTLDDFDPSRRLELFEALEEAANLLCRAMVTPGWPGDGSGRVEGCKFSDLHKSLVAACKELEPMKEYWVKVEIVQTERYHGSVLTKARSAEEARLNVLAGNYHDYHQGEFIEPEGFDIVDAFDAGEYGQ